MELAAGEVEIADYPGKMRLWFDEVVAKLKEEVSRQWGCAL